MSQSTISRELSRNSPDSPSCDYRAGIAAAKAFLRRHRPPPRIKPSVWAEVVRLLVEMDWSPQQNSSRLLAEQGVRVSHESIYGYLILDKDNGGLLYKHLPCAGKRRKRMGTIYTGAGPNAASRPLARPPKWAAW